MAASRCVGRAEPAGNCRLADARGEAGRTPRRSPAGQAVAEAVTGVGGKRGGAQRSRSGPELRPRRRSEAQGAGAEGGVVKSGLSGRKRAGAVGRPGRGLEGSLSCPVPSLQGVWGAHTLEHNATRFPNVRLLLCPIIGRSKPTSCRCPTSYPALSGPREVCILCPALGLLPSLPAAFSRLLLFVRLFERVGN